MNHSSANREVPSFSLRTFSILVVYVVFFGVLNETVFNVSTPAIAEQFQLEASGVSWVMTTFIITFGLGQVIFGRLTDLYPIRPLMVTGILIYAGSSLFGFVLQSWYPLVIVCRIFQGAGASALPALTMVIVARYFSPEQRGKLFGLFTSTSSLAIGVGPVIGGYISAYLHWSFLFLIPLFTLFSIPAFLRYLPKEERKERIGGVDIAGAGLLAVAITSLVLFTTRPVWWFLVISAVSTAVFVFHIRRTGHPFVEPKLFQNGLYRTGMMIGFLIFGTVFGILFLIPLMLGNLRGISTDDIGLIMFPGAFSAVIFGTIAGNVTSRKGKLFAFFVGLVPVCLSLLLMAFVTDKWIWYTGAALVLMYIGFSFLQTSMAETITQSLPLSQVGGGMGFYGFAIFVSGAVGTAGVGSLLDAGFPSYRILPFVGLSGAHLFSNLFLLFSLIIAAGGLMYFGTFARKKKADIPVPVQE